MRPVVFVSDLSVMAKRREPYRAALRAITDPVLKHLPEGRFSDRPDPEALNVRFFVITQDGKYDVFVGHGLADKLYSPYHQVVDFTAIFASGPTWHDRYIEQGCPPDKVHIGGFPKLDPIFNGEIKRRNGKRPRILWAPTHPTAWPMRYDVVRKVIRGLPFEIAEAQHPVLSSDSTLQALADADVVINDGGSILYEAWALGKPVVFPSWIVRRSKLNRPGSLERDIYRERIGYHAESREHLVEQIKRALADGITTAESDFIDGILPPELRGTSGENYARLLREIANS